MTAWAVLAKTKPKECVAIWYNSVSNAITLHRNNPDIFKIPSYAEYSRSFGKLSCVHWGKEKWEEKERVELNDSEFHLKTKCTLFFPAQGEAFFQKEYGVFSSWGFENGPYQGGSVFLANDISQQPLTLDIGSSTSECSVPIIDPVIIDNIIYLPEQISFTKFFDKAFGEHTFGGGIDYYDDSKVYRPDCLLRLKKFGDSGDNYIVFNTPVFDDESYSSAVPPESVRKCALKIIKNNQTINDDIKKLSNLDVGYYLELIFVKESLSKSIIDKIKRNCVKN